jgi:hypothetical protein
MTAALAAELHINPAHVALALYLAFSILNNTESGEMTAQTRGCERIQ